MLRYLFYRVLAAVPVMFGVLLVTFLLFHVAGGDPVLIMLGKNAKPAEIEALRSELRLDRPLVWGHWRKSELLPAQDFRLGAGAWEGLTGAGWRRDDKGRGRMELPVGQPLAVPVAFAQVPGARYQLRVHCMGGWEIGGVPLDSARDGWHSIPLAAGLKALTFRATTPGAALAGYCVEKYQPHAYESQLTEVLGEVVTFRRDPTRTFGFSVSFFNFGRTLLTGEPVQTVLRDGVGPSLTLMSLVFTLQLLVAVALALISSNWRNSWLDRSLVLLTVASMSVSYLVYILLGQYLLAYRLNLFPVWGFTSWQNLLLPVLVGVASGVGGDVRYYRTVFLNELFREHVRTAVAKGCGPWRVLLRHVLPNALVPVITRVSVLLPFLFTGSLLLESFFGIPGLGYAGVNALASGDLQLLKALVLVGAALFLAANVIADVACALVDPRIRLR